MKCPSCDKELAPDAILCTWCGAFVPASGRGQKANLLSRWFAWVIDPLIGVFLYFFALIVLGAIFPPLAFIAAILLPFVYLVWFLSLFRTGRTPGKLLMGLQVVRYQNGEIPGFWKMVLREIVGRFLSGLVFGLGYLWALFDKNSQAWHDKLAGTVVLKVRGRAASTATESIAPGTNQAAAAEPLLLETQPATASKAVPPILPLGVGAAVVGAVAVALWLTVFRPGTLQVTAEPHAIPRLEGSAGSRAAWTEVAHGLSGTTTMTKVRGGTYRLRVDGPGPSHWDSVVTVRAGGTTRVRVPGFAMATDSRAAEPPRVVFTTDPADRVESATPPPEANRATAEQSRLEVRRAAEKAEAARLAAEATARQEAEATAHREAESRRREEQAASVRDILVGQWYFDRNPAQVRANQIKAEGAYFDFESVGVDGSVAGAMVQPNNPEVPRMEITGNTDGQYVYITLRLEKGITRRWDAKLDRAAMRLAGPIKTISGPSTWSNNWSAVKR